MPLPLESYSWQKRHLLTVAVLIQAISGCKIVEFNNSESDDAKLPGQHPNELLGLVMGLILHDISLRTEKNVSAKIRYAPLDTISGAEIRAAIEVMIDKSRSNHRRRFAKLVKILGHFKTPITLH